jgi:hypothetical protein
MARRKNGVNMSEEIRQVFRSNPGIKPKEVVAALSAKGIDVADGLVYYIKGQLKGRRGRRRKVRDVADKVAATPVSIDPLATILRVKSLANDVGGIKKLKALIEALGA